MVNLIGYHCQRKSGPQSINIRFPSVSTKIEARRRQSRGSLLVHTSHWQPISGLPVDVPVPKKRFSLSDIFNLRHKLYTETIFYGGTNALRDQRDLIPPGIS